MRRLSRPCYDKAHRCPGWAGSAMRSPKGPGACNGGRIRVPARHRDYTEMVLSALADDYDDTPGAHRWRVGYCDTCNITTLPVGLCRLDPTNWNLRFRIRRIQWLAQDIARIVRDHLPTNRKAP